MVGLRTGSGLEFFFFGVWFVRSLWEGEGLVCERSLAVGEGSAWRN